MRSTFMVMRREIAAGRHVLLAAAGTGLLPLVMPLAPGLDRWPYPVARSMAAIFCTMAQAALLSIALGWSVIGRDLAEGRLGFYFSRPLPSGAIWTGKCLGILGIILGASSLTLLPTAILGSNVLWDLMRLPSSHLPRWFLFLAMSGACLSLIGLSNCLGTIFRTRSGWAAVHFPLLLCAIVLAAVSARRLLAEGATDALFYGTVGLGSMVLIALWAGLAGQVTLGRTELQRGHQVLSWILWPIVFCGLVGFELYSRWVVGVTAADISSLEMVGSTNNETWISVSGRAENRGNYFPVFLFDTATGRSLKTSVAGKQPVREMPVISRNGNRAVWLSGSSGDAARAVFAANLDGLRPEPVCTSISVTGPASLTVSDDGTRVALLRENLLSIYKLPGGEFAGGTALRSPNRIAAKAQFLGPDQVRIYLMPSGGGLPPDLEILEFDAAAKSLKTAGVISAVTKVWLPANRSLQKLVIWKRTPASGYLALCDARNGDQLKALCPDGTEGIQGVKFTADGRIVVLRKQIPEPAQLLVFTPGGEPINAIGLPGADAALGGEYAYGQWTVFVLVEPGWRLQSVDLDGGEIRTGQAAGLPICLWWERADLIEESGTVVPGDLQSRLYQSGNALTEYDPITGRSRRLIGPPAVPAKSPER